MSDADLYEFICRQLEEVDDGEGGETLLSIPDGVSAEQFERVLAQVEEDDENAVREFMTLGYGGDPL